MESHLVRIINRLEAMANDGGTLKRNFERDGIVVAEVLIAMTRKMVQYLPCVMLLLVKRTRLIAST